MLRKKIYLKVFIISFLLMVLISIPTMMMNHGYFIYSGDYNYQTIDFSVHVYNMIRSGFTKADLLTSLGTDFMTSFSHIIFTPFFVIELLMPDYKAVIFSLPFITSLKFSTACLTAYIYISKYVKHSESAFIGALLYGFSGFQSFNITMSSFADITAWFPLMLLFMDDYFEHKKRLRFAIIVFAMAAMSAFFFYGQVIYLVIYFCVKCFCKQYKITVKSIVGIFIEAFIGVLMAAILLFPTVMKLKENSRVSSYIHGIDCFSYADGSIVWRILQSIFMMPDEPAYTSLFPGENTWSSISLYLPCVGCVFVISHIKNNKKSWETILLLVSFIFMIIPILNSSFFMFNSMYYARWYYMPILIMALVTAKELENSDTNSWVFGLKISAVFLIFFALVACFPGNSRKLVDGKFKTTVSLFCFANDAIYFFRTAGIAALLLLMIYLIINKKYSKTEFLKKMIILVCGSIVALNIVYIHDVDGIDKKESGRFVEWSINKPDLRDDMFYRIDGNQVNSNLIWNVPALNNFITDSAPSLADFYDSFHISITQLAHIDRRYYPLNSLLSCKYYFNRSTGDNLNVELLPLQVECFYKKEIQPYYHIYENKAYIPIGFSYDYYITESELNEFTIKYGEDHPEFKEAESENKDEDDIDGTDVTSFMFALLNKPVEYSFSDKYLQKMLVMLRAIVIPDEDESKVSGMLSPLPDTMLEGLGTETYYADCADRKAECCSEFNVTKTGFEAKISCDKQNLVYFSVPIMDGWSAEVNGKEAEIVKVNYGFMAVKVDEGDNEIVFRYENKNFRTGAVISLVGLVMFIIYMTICKLTDRNNSKSEVKVDESPAQEGN